IDSQRVPSQVATLLNTTPPTALKFPPIASWTVAGDDGNHVALASTEDPDTSNDESAPVGGVSHSGVHWPSTDEAEPARRTVESSVRFMMASLVRPPGRYSPSGGRGGERHDFLL